MDNRIREVSVEVLHNQNTDLVVILAFCITELCIHRLDQVDATMIISERKTLWVNGIDPDVSKVLMWWIACGLSIPLE